MNHPLSTAFTVSYRFGVVVFSFPFIYMHILISFLISSVICWLFSSLSCIFSILVSRLFIYNSNLFLRFCIIFTIIIQNSLSGRFPISSSLVWWTFILFLYLLGISLPFHLVYIAVFGVAFLYSGSVWSSLYCGVSLL